MSEPASAARPVFVSPAKQGGWFLAVWVQPGAKKTEFAGTQGACLRVRLAAPAVENKANKALGAFVAGVLELRNSQVSLAAGHNSRRKRLHIDSGEEPDWTRLASP